jgi:hypothetical protein
VWRDLYGRRRVGDDLRRSGLDWKQIFPDSGRRVDNSLKFWNFASENNAPRAKRYIRYFFAANARTSRPKMSLLVSGGLRRNPPEG